MTAPKRGRLLVLEGADGTGKSTQARLLATRLRALLTREPGGTAIGEQLRSLFLHADLEPRAEALLVAAARAQHVGEVIEPALAAGRDVVSDRFTPSSIVYQGVARGLGVEAVAALSAFATGGLQPDVTVVLDLPDALADERRVTDADRFEEADAVFHGQVRAAYRSLAADRSGWVLVDAGGTVEEVAERVWTVVNWQLASDER